MDKKIILTDKSYVVQSASDLNEFCRPLFSTTPINYFHHGRLDSNGQIAFLNTNAEWIKYYASNLKPMKHLKFSDNDKVETSFSFLNISDPESAQRASDLFDISSFFIIAKRYKDHIDTFGFATHRTEKQDHDYFTRNFDIFNSFAHYFQSGGHQFIEDASNDLHLLPNYNELNLGDVFNSENKQMYNERPAWEREIFTAREIEVMHLVSCGFTNQQIANKLYRSKNTIDVHVGNIKEKLGGNNLKKSDIVQLLQKMGYGK
ncbi:response regulator transcription factor [Cysteiniphilum litorale]|uniref:response regulator transcription factor n=1 Tax=Cysteiniphilum litorale TaxID=2056700 RepID=UPI003F8841C2